MAKTKPKVCEKTFTKMWMDGVPTRIIAETLKISADRCDVTRRKLGLPRRESWHGAKAGKRKAYLPTEEEIRQKCLEIQAGWSDEERAKRLVGWSPESEIVEARVISESFASMRQSDGGSSVEDLLDLGTSGDF